MTPHTVASLTFLLHPIGLCVGPPHAIELCRGYNFWSGIGSDIGEVAIIGGLIQIVRHLNCHQHRCWRIGRFTHGHLKLCARHHPKVPDNGHITREHIDAIDA